MTLQQPHSHTGAGCTGLAHSENAQQIHNLAPHASKRRSSCVAFHGTMSTSHHPAVNGLESIEHTVAEHCGSPSAVDADIVIPVYNESPSLSRSIHTLHEFLSTDPAHHAPFTWNIVIADNASTDDTWVIARQLCTEFPADVRALRTDRKGRGYALKYAWGESLAKVMAYMDVDLSTDIRSTGTLIGSLLVGGADIAIGSRLMSGSDVTRSTKREFISRTYNIMLRSYLGARFHDAQCGFKAITAAAARQLLGQVKDNEWFFDTELLMLAQQCGMLIYEIPVRWVEDTDSTVNILDTVRKDLAGMHRMRREISASGSDIGYQLSGAYSSIGWDDSGQRELRGSLIELANVTISSPAVTSPHAPEPLHAPQSKPHKAQVTA